MLKNKSKLTKKDNQDKKDNQEMQLMGWICPKCGRVLSPYTSVCPCYFENKSLQPSIPSNPVPPKTPIPLPPSYPDYYWEPAPYRPYEFWS